MISKTCSPVLFIIFNRPSCTKRVFEEIKKAKPRKLFIAADGPRLDHPDDLSSCEKSRNIINQVDWNCDLKTMFRNNNLGCKYGPISAINWFFENVDKGIILEDDCFPDQSFFMYCTELLELYENNSKILSISGHNFGLNRNKNTYLFSRFMNMWGWATWKDRAEKVDYSMKKWKNKKLKVLFLIIRLGSPLLGDFDWKWIKKWYNTFNNCIKKNQTSWDYHWIFYGINQKMLNIVPNTNLIKNIGFGEDATHTKDKNHLISKIEVKGIELPLIKNNNEKYDKSYEIEYIKGHWQSHQKRKDISQIRHFIRDMLK